MKIMERNPRLDGFSVVAEFEEHEQCYMMWPERTDNWREGGKPAQLTYAAVAEAIAEFEPVTMLVSPEQYQHARFILSDKIRVIEMSYNDAWIRDFGPMYVKNDQGDIRAVDWRFNAWGGLLDGLYFPWDKDDQVAEKICDIEHIDFYYIKKFILEGCSVHFDGQGTLITTEECLLSEGRNPDYSKAEIEEMLKTYCNVDKVIWLKRGVYFDETNGHIDNILNFVRPGVIVLTWSDDEDDLQYEISRECYEILSNARDAQGRQFEIHKINYPNSVFITKEESEGIDMVNGTYPRLTGDRLSATYVNYYTANGGIIFPTFDDPNDEHAKRMFEQLYPDYKVIGIPAREILLGGGNIHCITQGVPKRKKK
ncbi:agmatine deiminase [Culicoidibacter larvae]|uniref:Putative agmatine deiminase n=1 Tax=Culicoidibacter larvae TaxID=2579976 RepID=A0A5R8QGE1_9FIRM|nr:agmatine deiminase [Culicoidibacter larvae]TLG76780.1 agmatine deiminase [Culicoidibacter larvae]